MGLFFRFLPKRQDAPRKRPTASPPRGREAQAQAEAPRAAPEQLLHGRQVPRLLHITTVFSHAQTVVLCVGCSTVLCQPTGGKARLTEGCSFRRSSIEVTYPGL